MLIFSEKTSSQKQPAMSDQMSGPWGGAEGGTGFLPDAPTPGLMPGQLACRVPTRRLGWVSVPAWPSMAPCRSMLCAVPPKGSRGRGCCPATAAHPSVPQPLQLLPRRGFSFQPPPVTDKVWHGWRGHSASQSPSGRWLRGQEHLCPPCACSGVRSAGVAGPHQPHPLSRGTESFASLSWSHS